MEENKVVTVNENEEEVSEVKESKKGFLAKVGTGIKNNWKTIAVGTGALMLGLFLGSRKSDDTDYETEEVSEPVAIEEHTEE